MLRDKTRVVQHLTSTEMIVTGPDKDRDNTSYFLKIFKHFRRYVALPRETAQKKSCEGVVNLPKYCA